MMRELRLLTAGFGLGAILAWGGVAASAPLPLPGPGVPPTAGESDLTSFVVGPANDLTVDWMVIPDPGGYPGGPYPAGSFIYLYQLESTPAVTAPDLFTVTVPPGTVIAAGVLPGDDLDLPTAFHPAHIAANFPILLGPPAEEEGFVFTPLGAVLTTISADGTVTWTFAPLAAGTQSNTLFFVSPNPPAYGNAVSMDSIPPSPWGTLAVGADQVPVPFVGQSVPEPGTLLLLGAGLLATMALAFRRSGDPLNGLCQSHCQEIFHLGGGAEGRKKCNSLKNQQEGFWGSFKTTSENFTVARDPEIPSKSETKKSEDSVRCEAGFRRRLWHSICYSFTATGLNAPSAGHRLANHS